MSFELYSLVLSVAVVALGVATTAILLSFLLFPKLRACLRSKSYTFYLTLIGTIAAISTISALSYQYIYGLEVCVLCWWQRIFMFPIEVMVFFSLLYNDRSTHLATGTLAVMGFLFAGYHYYNHYQNIILGQDVVLPCGTIGLVPSCSEFSFTYFGFLTLPFMALMAFYAIIVLAVLAHYAKPADSK